MVDRQRKRGDGSGYRVLLKPQQLFEYLVLDHVEREELRQERNGLPLDQASLIKRFVKYPIKFALNHNPFYAAASMCFGLCKYKAREALQLYQRLIPEAIVKGDRECSRAKRALNNGLLDRFRGVAAQEVHNCGAPQALRLRRRRPSPDELHLVKEALKRFAPSTPAAIVPPWSSSDGALRFSVDADEAEMQRLHAFFNLEFFDWLTRAHRLDSFDSRAHIPVIQPSRAPELSPDETPDSPLSEILALIDDEQRRESRAVPGSLRIRVDGIDRAIIADSGVSVPMLLEESASVVELIGRADGAEVVLGTHVLTYDGEKNEQWTLALPWSDREQLRCTFRYGSDDCVAAVFARERRSTSVSRPPVSPRERSAAERTSERPHVGQMIGDYKVVAELGCGSLGRTWLAAGHSGRMVALKILAPCYGGGGELPRHLPILGSPPCVASAHHRALATFFDHVEWNGHSVLVRDYVDGTTLEQTLLNGPLTPRATLRLAKDILAGLAVLHRSRLLHGDLRPSNIVLTPGRTVRLVDFGLSSSDCARSSDSRSQRHEAYLSPEQLERSDVDARADLFALGVVIYEMLTSQLPWTERRAGRFADAVGPTPPDAINPSVDRHLGAVVVKALDSDPQARYQTAFGFARALRRTRHVVARTAAAAREHDRRLTLAFQHGDTSAAEALCDRYAAFVRGIVKRFGGDQCELTDVRFRLQTELLFQRNDLDPHEDASIELWRLARVMVCRVSSTHSVVEIDRLAKLEADSIQSFLRVTRRRLLRLHGHSLDLEDVQTTWPRNAAVFASLLVASVSVLCAGTGVAGSSLVGIAVGLLAVCSVIIADCLFADKQNQLVAHYRRLAEGIESLRAIRGDTTSEWFQTTITDAPQDWRQVVPVARWIAAVSRSAGSLEESLAHAPRAVNVPADCRQSSDVAGGAVTLAEIVAASDRDMASLRMRPSVREIVRSLLGRS
jgi:hypothetical protein